MKNGRLAAVCALGLVSLLPAGCSGPAEPAPGAGGPPRPIQIPLYEGHLCGAVFHDVDRDGAYRTNDVPLGGVQVTDGRRIAATDGAGLFRLPQEDAAQYVIVTQPSGYVPPLDGHAVPRFFVPVPQGPQEEAYLFPLVPWGGRGAFTAVVMNDIHLEVVPGQGGHNPDQDPVDTFNEYVDEFLALDPPPDFVVSVGDQSGVVPGDTAGLDAYVEACGRLGVPVYNAMGNPGHNDGDLDRVFFKGAYRERFGPLYYALDVAGWHLVVLDTNLISGDHGQELAFGLDERQRAWLEEDLALNGDKPLLIFYHEPIDNTENAIDVLIKVLSGRKPDLWIDKQGILELFRSHGVRATFAGHTHTNGLYQEAGTLYVTNGAVSGAWWGPNFNGLMELLFPEYAGLGINSGPDGTPQGYRLLTLGPERLSSTFKAFREERRVAFANPAATDVGAGKLSYLDLDLYNGYTFLLEAGAWGDGFPGAGTPVPEPLRGEVTLVVNACSLRPVRGVDIRIDDGPWRPAEPAGGLLWTALLDTRLLEPGEHALWARVTDTGGERAASVAIRTEVE